MIMATTLTAIPAQAVAAKATELLSWILSTATMATFKAQQATAASHLHRATGTRVTAAQAATADRRPAITRHRTANLATNRSATASHPATASQVSTIMTRPATAASQAVHSMSMSTLTSHRATARPAIAAVAAATSTTATMTSPTTVTAASTTTESLSVHPLAVKLNQFATKVLRTRTFSAEAEIGLSLICGSEGGRAPEQTRWLI